MKSVVLVALGGATGSVLRYLLSAWTFAQAAHWRFPIGTFVVNILGCLMVGLLAGLMAKHQFLSPDARLFLITGIAGGFTTFSALGMETFHLFRLGDMLIAGSYVASSVIVGILCVWVGFELISGRG